MYRFVALVTFLGAISMTVPLSLEACGRQDKDTQLKLIPYRKGEK